MLKKIIPLALLAVSTVANADSYLGMGFGQSSAEIVPLNLGAGFVSTVSDTDTAIKLFGGFEFSNSLSMEVGYTHFGEMSVDYTDGVDTAYETAETSTTYVAVVGNIPLGNAASLFGKVGISSWYMDYSYSDSGMFIDASASGVDPMFGVGLQLNAANLSVRAEFERYLDIGDQYTIGQSDVDVLSVSGMLWF